MKFNILGLILYYLIEFFMTSIPAAIFKNIKMRFSQLLTVNLNDGLHRQESRNKHKRMTFAFDKLS